MYTNAYQYVYVYKYSLNNIHLRTLVHEIHLLTLVHEMKVIYVISTYTNLVGAVK